MFLVLAISAYYWQIDSVVPFIPLIIFHYAIAMANKTLIKTIFIRFNAPAQLIPTRLNAGPLFFSSKPNYPNQLQYRKQISLANIFQRYGFSPSQLHSFITANNFLLNSNSHDIEKSMGLLLSFKIPQKILVSLVSECPAILDFEFLKNWEWCFSNSGGICVSPLVIKSVLSHSKRFQVDPDEFIKSVNDLKGLGFCEGTIRRVLEDFPGVITTRRGEIHGKIEFFRQIGIPEDEIEWILSSYPAALGFGIKNKLMPLFNEFVGLGFSREMVVKEIKREPQVLGMEVGELSRCLELVNSLKCREPIRLKIMGDGTFRAGFEVKLRVDCFCRHGLIRREAFKVLWKEPRVIIYDIEDIEQKIQFLVNTMRFHVGTLVEVPEYLGVSFEKQIVPRYNVIEYLRAKGGLGDEVGLKGMIKLSRLKFYNLYVKPYSECERMYARFSGDVQVKRQQHPVGLWKMFKPQMHRDSKEDVKNMKSFMEGLAR